MSYSADELFEIVGGAYDGKAFVWRFLKEKDPDVKSVEIPSEYNGYPVNRLHRFCFSFCDYLEEVYIPDSVEELDMWTFSDCPKLRSVRLPKNAVIGMQAFDCCPLLPPETIMAGLVGSAADITVPFNTEEVIDEDVIFSAEQKLDWPALLRPDVLELAIKYDSFRLIGTNLLFRTIAVNGLFSDFDMLERAGITPDPEQTEQLIDECLRLNLTEMTAFLLDYKRRKFGFDKGGSYEL